MEIEVDSKKVMVLVDNGATHNFVVTREQQDRVYSYARMVAS